MHDAGTAPCVLEAPCPFAGLRREQRDPDDIGLIDVAARSIDAIQTVIARFRLAAYLPDVYLKDPGNVCAFHEFHRAASSSRSAAPGPARPSSGCRNARPGRR
ncbi:MAG: hypothetical protein ACT4QB_16575 [Gammaproteobacteria bacterium]